MALTESLKKMELDNPSLALANLDDSSKYRVMERVNKLDITDTNSILEYGVESSKRLREYTHSLLETTRVKDNPEVEGLMLSLVGELEQVDASTLSAKKQGLIARLFKKDEVKQLLTKYETVDGVLRGISDKLGKAKFELMKDIEQCTRFGNSTISYIKELDEDILVIKLKIEELKQQIQEMELKVDTTDQLEVYELEDLKAVYNRLDKRAYDLSLVRSASVLLLPQLKLIRDGNEVLVDKITTSINTAIPMWESQIALAIQTSRQKNAQLVQKAVADTTNNLIRNNSKMLMEGSIEIAKEMERGVIDVEALKQSTENLIKTINEVRNVQIQGIAQRKQANGELAKLQNQLNTSFLQLTDK